MFQEKPVLAGSKSGMHHRWQSMWFYELSLNSLCCTQSVQLSSTARQHIKLDRLEEFHCIMPKDMTKPQGAPKTPFDPSTAPAASLNTGAATSRPQAAASQQVDTASQATQFASQAKGAASQSEAAASQQQSMVSVPSSSITSAPGQARLGSADSPGNDAVSKRWDSTITTSSSGRSSSSSNASDNGPRRSNLQDTNNSNISTAKAGSVSSVGLGDTQVAVGNNGDATSNLSKPDDGAVSNTGEADAVAASAPQQAQQAAQGTRRTEQNTEEQEEEQALSGSVSKSGFEFCGSGHQFKVSCKA